MTEATLRAIREDGLTYLAALDVAALLLDVAAEVSDHPDLRTADVLRSLSAGLADYPGPPPPEAIAT